MEALMRKTFMLLMLVLLPVAVLAQSPGSVSRAEMKKLDFMAGRWQGEGWIELGPERHTFRQTETIESKVDGLVMVVEGLGKDKAPGKENVVVHNAFAVVSYDGPAKQFRWRAFRADGLTLDVEARVSENSLVWGFPAPRGGDIRFTIKLTEKGEWFEVGEFSQDGKTWLKFFEMTLQRVK
jgi:hypothetical protein